MAKTVSPEAVQLASIIKNTRIYSGFSQDEIAREVGLSRPSVSQTEAGHRQIGAIELRKWAKIFRLPINYFLPDPEGVTPTTEFTANTQDLPDEEKRRVVSFAHYLRTSSTTPNVNRRTVEEEERKRIMEELGPEMVLQLEMRDLDVQSKAELKDFIEFRKSKSNPQV